MKWLWILVVLPLVLDIQAQEALFDKESKPTGGFGGTIVEFGNIRGEFGTGAGGHGGVVFDEFFIGGFGFGADYGRVTTVEDQFPSELSIGMGGLIVGYTVATEKIIHFYSSVKIGWGVAALKGTEEYSDGILAVTPEAGIELNLFKWFRMAGTVGYRWISGVSKVPGVNNDDFRTVTVGWTMRFGKFR